MKRCFENIEYLGYSLQDKYTKEDLESIFVPEDLLNILADPKKFKSVQPSPRKIYLGDSSANPKIADRYPFWIDPDILSSHVLIAGAIGSGKTSLTFRMLAGALNHSRSVIVSEAKSGLKGGDDGAAYTNLVNYLGLRDNTLHIYRWPRGNCYFNPLLYLETPQEKRIFFDFIKEQVIKENHIQGEMIPFIAKAINISTCIFNFMQLLPDKQKNLTIRRLVFYLRNPVLFKQEYCEFLEEMLSQPETQSAQMMLYKLEIIRNDLTRYKYFTMYEDERFIMTPFGVDMLIKQLDFEDLLKYSEPQTGLKELTINDVLYDKSLVVISQPLYDPSSAVVGPLFWDCLLSKIIELGPNPADKNGVKRKKVLAILDESHRLPVGKLGDSGDFLRQYDLGVIEITPAIIDDDRWHRNKHVYQTIISMTPGVTNVVGLIQERLPNFPKNNLITQVYQQNGNPTMGINFPPDHTSEIAEDNPGISSLSLANTGRFTALIQSFILDEKRKVFWIDIESSLLKNIEYLLEKYIKNKESVDNDKLKELKNVIDYALGLETKINY